MRKLSILFSFFFLMATSVFAQCDSLSITPLTAFSVIEDGSGGYYVAVELNNSSSGSYDDVTITAVMTPINGYTIAVSSVLMDIAQGIDTVFFPITNQNVLVDIKESNIISGFFVAGTLTFSSLDLACTEFDYTPTQINTWGCSDPNAFNYESTVILDLDNYCITTICPFIDFLSMEVTVDGSGNPIFRVIIQNFLETFSFDNAMIFFVETNTNGMNFDVHPGSLVTTVPAYAGGVFGYDILEFPLDSALSLLAGDSLYLEGYFDFTVDINGQVENCILSIDETIDISRIGCTDPDAYNYDPYNTIDDGDCIFPINISPDIIFPPCNTIPGSIDIEGENTTGGTPPYNFEYYTVDPYTIIEGSYTFTVTDNTPASENGPIIQHVTINIPTPPLFYVNIHVEYPLIVATTNSAVSAYHWLLDGVVIAVTPQPYYAYEEIGTYACYVEGMNNECFDYSNELFQDSLGVDDILAEANLILYPNPARNELNIGGMPSSVDELNYHVINTLGAQVQSGTMYNGDFRISTEELSNGMYYLMLQNATEVKNIAFTVRH